MAPREAENDLDVTIDGRDADRVHWYTEDYAE
jgi:hypothetical protein